MKAYKQFLATLILIGTLVIYFQNCSKNTSDTSSDTTTTEAASSHIDMTSAPSSLAVDVGKPIILTVTATSIDDKTLTYQWYKNGVTISGQTGTYLYISNAAETDEGYYSVIISDGTYSLGSNWAYVQVGGNNSTSPTDHIQITSSPTSVSVGSGDTAILQIQATSLDDLTLTYQWYKDGNTLSGQNSNYLYINNASEDDDGYYSVSVSDGTYTVTSTWVTVSVGTSSKITFSTQPAPTSINSGETAYLEVVAADSDSSALSYQWYFNGVAISGATDSRLFITDASSANDGYYYVKVSSASTTVISNTVKVSVSTTYANCDSGKTYAGHCYKLYATTKGFNGAVSYCNEIGGYLAKVTSSSENSFINSLLTEQAITRTWIGASDSVTEGTFRWRDGEVLSYVNWDTNQPDHSSSNIDCVLMTNTGVWRVNDCANSRSFVCEFQ